MNKITIKNIAIYSFFTTLILMLAAAPLMALQRGSDVSVNLTEAEKAEAQEIAVRFAFRFSQTNDVAPLLDEMFADDFIENYKKETLDMFGENDRKVDVMPGLFADAQFLRKLDSENWKTLYISTNNFLLSTMRVLIEKTVKNQGKPIEDSEADELFSPQLKNLFAQNQNTLDLINYQGKSKPIDSIEEFKSVIEVLNHGTKIFNEENPSPFQEEQTVKILRAVGNENIKIEVTTAREGDYGLAKDDKLISLVSPNMYYLVLAKKGNKLKIVWATPYAD